MRKKKEGKKSKQAVSDKLIRSAFQCQRLEGAKASIAVTEGFGSDLLLLELTLNSVVKRWM